jgi:prepilin signal peptidase PulO-like enzyme (type II secretory pathway)
MIESVKTGSRHVFELGVFGTKIVLIFLLLILSFINADVSFIKDKPRMFLFESVVVGLSAGVPFTYIAMNRGRDLSDAISLGVTAFLIFFLFHIVMEFSGQNQALVDETKLTKTEQKQQAVIEKVTKFKATKWIIFAIMMIMLILALVVRDIGPGFGVVTREAFLMAICGALPTIMIAKDRDEKDSLKIFKEFMTYFGVFFAGHYALQMGGFYTHLFMKKPDEELP